MKKEVNGVVGIIIVLLILIILVLASSLIVVLNKNNKNSNETNKPQLNENTEKEYAKIENIDAIAKDFYDNFIFSNRLLFFNYDNVFKNGNKFNVSELSSNDKMLITYEYVYWNNYKIGSDNSELSAEEFKNYYAKLFGISGYQNINFNGGFCRCQAGLEIVYDANLNKFIKKAAIEGCGSGPYSEKYLYDKVEQAGDKIKLYIKVGYASPDTTHVTVDVNKIILYSDHEMKNIVATNVNLDDLSPYKDKLNTLVYTLVKDNDNYVLERIEVVK